jgi:hypothetical protein
MLLLPTLNCVPTWPSRFKVGRMIEMGINNFNSLNVSYTQKGKKINGKARGLLVINMYGVKGDGEGSPGKIILVPSAKN